MLNVEKAISNEKLNSRLLLQVHDELIFEVVGGEESALTELVRREMAAAYTLRAPLDVSVGKNISLSTNQGVTEASSNIYL